MIARVRRLNETHGYCICHLLLAAVRAARRCNLSGVATQLDNGIHKYSWQVQNSIQLTCDILY